MCSSLSQMQDGEEHCKWQSANERSSPFLPWKGEEYWQWEEAEWRPMENAWGIRPSAPALALTGYCCFCCRGLLSFWAADTVSLTFISSWAEAQDLPVPTFSFSRCLGTSMTPEPGAFTHLSLTKPRTNIPAWSHTDQVQSSSAPAEFTVLSLACKANSKPKILSSNLGLEGNGAIILK